MTDSSTLRAAHRAAADAGRRAAEAVGARPTRVLVRVRSYSGAIHASGTALVSVFDTEITPRPKVRQLGPGESSFYGGGPAAQPGTADGRTYEVGPITLPYSGGGYSLASLLPPETPSSRTTLVLLGDDFVADGEEFDLAAQPDASRPHQVVLRVTRTRQGP